MKSFITLFFFLSSVFVHADGKVIRRQLEKYEGSLEESAQEAIIIYKDYEDGAIENLILKIDVEGPDKDFAWVVPFPQVPKIYEEKSILFDELFNYVEYMRTPSYPSKKSAGDKSSENATKSLDDKVKVISRKTVGSFETAVVSTEEPKALNTWLKKEGYQELVDQDDVIKSYIDKKYFFACMKVKRDSTEGSLHPLRFEFKTGGHDGIYFPMKMTGLQTDPFDINLYVFYQAWLNKDINKFGYAHLDFQLKYRDHDTRQCDANAGKSWSNPEGDPLLKRASHIVPNVKKLFSKLYPGERFYLSNISSKDVQPVDMRQWKDDLWLFPHYTNKSMIPKDVSSGIASGFWPDEKGKLTTATKTNSSPKSSISLLAIVLGGCGILALGFLFIKKN